MTKYLWILLLVVTSTCFGQRSYLMLQKKSRSRNAYYVPGDVISFRLIGDKTKITSEILDLKDSVIVFSGFSVHIKEISRLYIDEKTKWWLRFKLAQLTLIGGTAYLLLDFVNTGELNKESLLIGGTIIGVGLIAKLLIGNSIRIKGRTKLKILLL